MDNIQLIADFLNDYLTNTEETDALSFLRKTFPKTKIDQVLNALARIRELAQDWDEYPVDDEGLTMGQMTQFDKDYLIPTAKEINSIMEKEQ